MHPLTVRVILQCLLQVATAKQQLLWTLRASRDLTGQRLWRDMVRFYSNLSSNRVEIRSFLLGNICLQAIADEAESPLVLQQNPNTRGLFDRPTRTSPCLHLGGVTDGRLQFGGTVLHRESRWRFEQRQAVVYPSFFLTGSGVSLLWTWTRSWAITPKASWFIWDATLSRHEGLGVTHPIQRTFQDTRWGLTFIHPRGAAPSSPTAAARAGGEATVSDLWFGFRRGH